MSSRRSPTPIDLTRLDDDVDESGLDAIGPDDDGDENELDWSDFDSDDPVERSKRPPRGCIDCGMRRLRCNKARPSCSRCSEAGWICSYKWTLGPHIFWRFGPDCDVGPRLEPIRRPYEARGGAYGRVYPLRMNGTTGTGQSGTLVAVKVLHNHKWHPGRALQLCLREACIWAQLAHPNVTPLWGVADYAMLVQRGDPEMCLISPWASHGNAEEYVRAEEPDRMSVLIMLWDITCGLEYLHSGWSDPIIHGDLKANNILMFSDPHIWNGRIRACLVDFGISRSWYEGDSIPNTTTLTGHAGNMRWMAWERIDPQAHGFAHMPLAMTTNSDVFEMMRTFLEILTRTPPYAGLPDSQVFRKVIDNINPDRPSRGLLGLSPGVWDLLSWGWMSLQHGRPLVSEVKVMLECIILQTAVDRQEQRVRGQGSLPDQVLDLVHLGDRFNSLCIRSRLDAQTFFPLARDGYDVVCSTHPSEKSSVHISPQMLPGLLKVIPVSGWKTLRLNVDSLDDARRVIEACRWASTKLETLILVIEDRASEGYEGWPWTKEPSCEVHAEQGLLGGLSFSLDCLVVHLLPVSWCIDTYYNLRSLQLCYHPGPLRPTRDEWSKLMRATPNLWRLTVINSGPEINDNLLDHQEILEKEVIDLLELKELVLGCLAPSTLYYLIYTLRAPQLQYLSLRRMLQGDYRRPLALIDHERFPNVTFLIVYYTNWTDEVFLALVSRLREVNWLALWYGDRHLEALTRHCRGLGPGEPLLLPKLEKLFTNGCMCKTARQFLKERCGPGFSRRWLWIWRDHKSEVGHHCRALENLCRGSRVMLVFNKPNPDIRDQTKDFDHAAYQASRLEEVGEETDSDGTDEELVEDEEMTDESEEMDEEEMDEEDGEMDEDEEE